MSVVSWRELAVGRRKLRVRQEGDRLRFRDLDVDAEFMAARLTGTIPGELALVARAVQEEVSAGKMLDEVLTEVDQVGRLNQAWRWRVGRTQRRRPESGPGSIRHVLVTPAHLAYLVAPENSYSYVAADPRLPEWLMELLVEDSRVLVRRALAQNRQVPARLRMRLLKDSDEVVLLNLSSPSREDLSHEEAMAIAARVLATKDEFWWKRVAEMPVLPTEVALKLAKSWSLPVREALAERKDLSDEVLDTLYASKDRDRFHTLRYRLERAREQWASWEKSLNSEPATVPFSEISDFLRSVSHDQLWELRKTAPPGVTVDEILDWYEMATRAHFAEARSALKPTVLEI